MDWRMYETEIYKKLKSDFPKVHIEFDVKILGHQSKVERQVDVLALGKFLGQEITVAVECKYYAKNIDVKIVDGFIGFLEDIKADLGIIITNKGFSSAAKNRAEAKKIRLEILTFKEFEEYNLASAMYEEIYEEEAGLEPLPDDQEILERINENEDILEMFELARDYKGSITAYADEIQELYDSIKVEIKASQDIEYVRTTLYDVLYEFNKYEVISSNRYHYYQAILEYLNSNQLLGFLNDIDMELESFRSNVYSIENKCSISDEFFFDCSPIILENFDGDQAIIQTNGNVFPDRGGADSILLKLITNGCVDASGIIEVSYGDYEISDGGYAMPTFSDGFYLNIEEIKCELEIYINNSLNSYVELRNELYRLSPTR
ncbi:hypothetical protein PAEAM_28460 [Paenibacillus sp. GM1FR]|uniref:restriction endonuclease n=1 Tax=Paenibacillus sp. GM1FR TaxID=2059267 RepID=UPI000C26EA90|nr:restriction endonuclease [Paenibacillus sp. GM1FR]PJN59811.1 hypothetical protein PAEAM_28460 [Paenibacillus sp. GM1FR]